MKVNVNTSNLLRKQEYNFYIQLTNWWTQFKNNKEILSTQPKDDITNLVAIATNRIHMHKRTLEALTREEHAK